ncbi:MAG: S41 family peptidase [bacterium]
MKYLKSVFIKYLLILFVFFISFNNSTLSSQKSDKDIYYERLFLTCKVWGFVKYYHSEIAKGNLNWDNILIQMIDNIKKIYTNEGFNQLLKDMIDSAGEMAKPSTPLPQLPDSLKCNMDFDWFGHPLICKAVKARLDTIKSRFRPHSNYYVVKDKYVGYPTFDGDAQFYKWGYDEYPIEAKRLLALFRYWNIIAYFYPYKTMMDQNWDTTLVEFIPRIVQADDTVSYHLTFKELATRLNDSHSFLLSNVIYTQFMGNYYLPLTLGTIENKTVVTNVLKDNLPIQIGDFILSINGIAINVFRDSLRTYAWGSNDAATNDIINSMILRGKKEFVQLEIENSEVTVQITLSRDIDLSRYLRLLEKTGPIWQLLDADSGKLEYGYVDMGRLEIAHIDSMFTDLWAADGIIFDLRDYPNNTMPFLIRYLFHGPIHPAKFLYPDITYPGTFYWHSIPVGLGGFPKTYYKPVILLFNENTISQGEYTVMALEQHQEAIKIGSQTAGADGNVSYIYLPGGIWARFTVLGVFYPDYTPTQRIGIVPDIEVHPTISGVREGRDEVLEAALRYKPEQGSPPPSIDKELPRVLLFQNYPNPFNTSTTVRLKVNEKSKITLSVFNVLGQRIQILVNTFYEVGQYEVLWDGCHANGQNAASGLYFIQLVTEESVIIRKIVLLR